jgi:hypothetical protein
MFGGFGKTLMIVGGVLFLIGALSSLGVRLPWFGRLPGDIVVERDNFRFYFPIVTSIAISIILTVLAYLFRR